MRLIICVISLIVLTNANESCEVEKAFSRDEIDKDTSIDGPLVKLDVHYAKSKVIVNLGNLLESEDVKEQPEVTYNSDPKAFYTLLMIDLDAPSRKNPKEREVQHWLIVNIPGSDISKGEVYATYRPPTPPPGSGLHRYVFYLFKQSGKLSFNEPKHPVPSTTGRLKFSTKKFADKYKLGDPVAGNFYQLEN